MKEPRNRLHRRPGAARVVDVARLAGCSTATVSRVQNNPLGVSADIRDRVHAAIRELGYVPNSAARALRSQSSRMMGILIPTLRHAIYASLVEAAQRQCAEEGYSLLVATFEYDLAREAEQAAVLIERGTEGLIVVGDQHDRHLYRLLRSAEIPHVNTYVYDVDSPHPCIGIDNARASFELAEFLVGLGHREFGMITAATTNNDRASARVDGVRQALATRDLSLDPDAIVMRPYGIDSGRDGFRTLLARRPGVTAVICGNDVLAFGALIESRECGFSVPADISIVGFDNLDFTPHLVPPLTTMEVPAAEMGAGAARFLLDTLRGRSPQSKIRLEPKMIMRRTTTVAPSSPRPSRPQATAQA